MLYNVSAAQCASQGGRFTPTNTAGRGRDTGECFVPARIGAGATGGSARSSTPSSNAIGAATGAAAAIFGALGSPGTSGHLNYCRSFRAKVDETIDSPPSFRLSASSEEKCDISQRRAEIAETVVQLRTRFDAECSDVIEYAVPVSMLRKFAADDRTSAKKWCSEARSAGQTRSARTAAPVSQQPAIGAVPARNAQSARASDGGEVIFDDRCLRIGKPRILSGCGQNKRWHMTQVSSIARQGCPKDVFFTYNEPNGEAGTENVTPFQVQTCGGPPTNIRTVPQTR